MQTSTGLYFKDGEVITRHGEVTIYRMDDILFLEVGPGHNLWALESEYSDYMAQLGDKPRGDCLEIGLGLGIASRCILTYPSVDTLTTIELRKNVIKSHEDIVQLLDKKSEKWAPYDSKRHIIKNYDGFMYMLKTTNKYDFIFMDFYKHIDEDSICEIKDMVKCAKLRLNPGGKVLGWFDPHTPVEFIKDFFDIFN